MKKKVTIAFVLIGILVISIMIIFSTYKSSEAYRKAKAETQWECSVVCAEKSTPDSYVITYSDAKILDELDGRITLLDEWESETLGEDIPLSREYIGKEDYLTNKEKCDILLNLTNECIDTIKYNEIYVEGYKKKRKIDKDLDFLTYKKEVKNDERNTFFENIFLDDEEDEIEG